MKVDVIAEDGKIYAVPVRYSPLCRLYTTETVYKAATKGQDPNKAMGASAPFYVFKGEWDKSGFTMPTDFYDVGNLVAEVLFVDNMWNNK